MNIKLPYVDPFDFSNAAKALLRAGQEIENSMPSQKEAAEALRKAVRDIDNQLHSIKK